MRLTEIAPNFVMGQSGTLLTILQHLKMKLGDGATVPMNAVANLMRNVGYGLAYDDFKKMYDENPQVQGLVGNFNEHEITLGSDQPDPEVSDQEDADSQVDQMAQKAAQNNIGS